MKTLRSFSSALLFFCLGALCFGASAGAQIHRVTDSVRAADLERLAERRDMLLVPMRDGVHLATEVYLPKDGDGPFPVIFWRTPYNFSPLLGSNPNRPNARLKYALDAVERGYAFVTQNERGKFFSEGDWEILGRPRTDGWDALDWIAAQDWSNGRVATLGCSSTAEWQMGLAEKVHPAHAAAVPMGYGAGVGQMGPYVEQGSFYRGGALQMPMALWMFGEQHNLRPTFPAGTTQEQLRQVARFWDLAPRSPAVDWRRQVWHLPVSEMLTSLGGEAGVFEESVRRLPGDPAWKQGGLHHDDAGVGVPALWVNSWFDLSVGPNLETYRHARAGAARDDQYMIVAPTDHCSMYRLRTPHVEGEMNMGDVSFGMDEHLFAFLDAYVGDPSGEAVAAYQSDYPRVKYYSMGRNEWRGSEDWPPAEVEEHVLHLTSDRGAQSSKGDGALVSEAGAAGSDTFVYDPAAPVPTQGGNFCCLADWEPGALDQRGVESRGDVLVYTTEPLSEPLDVVGHPRVVLHVSSDARDTDFTVKLVDVAPDGKALNLDDSILRVRYREGFDREVFLTEGETVEIEIGPLSTAHVFEAGHRVRLEISSSNFPRYDRNLNTGGNNWDESQGVVARNTVHHGAATPSRLILPVRP